MASSKAALKATKFAIDEHRYEDALTQAEKVLISDPHNYHANVFHGLALDKLNRSDEAIGAYQTAINAKGADPLAWQGLIGVYEKQGQDKVDEYHRAALRLAELYKEADDVNKCQNVVDKYHAHVRNHGSKSQQKQALEMILPSSSLYEFLEGRVPYPSTTYAQIAQIVEAEESEHINKEIGKRRTRLGARIDQVRREVRQETLTQSPLEDIYQQIINWTRDDEERRNYEEKLLHHAYETMVVLAANAKVEKRAQVVQMAQGMVILKHPYRLAWSIVIEWNDGTSLADWDEDVLRDFLDLFPEDGLAKVLRGYLSSEISPINLPVNKDEGESLAGAAEPEQKTNDSSKLSLEDRLVLMTDGLAESNQSILAHRLMAEYYQFLEEFESAVELCRKLKGLIASAVQDTGLPSERTLESNNIILAMSLIRYHPPKYFDEARSLLNKILKVNPSSTPALLGKGQLLGEQEDYPAALKLLETALTQRPDDLTVKLEVAWYQALCGDDEKGLEGLEACLPLIDGTDMRTRNLKARTLHRIGVCLWNLDPSPAARKKRTGAYARFLGALQADANYAPAYTSLGLYYADYGKDKKRARKCFLKAVELSASEVVAAERLARSYADESDWDLVELVAQRVVDSGKTRPDPGSKRKGVSWPLAALGVVQLNKQEYVESIVSFQHALRISPEDYHSWIGLGESYHNSGRYIAATKAFQQAQEVHAASGVKEAEESWLAKFLSANVKRELGQYEEAIQGYQDVLRLRAGELGVAMALVQTLVDAAWQSIQGGFFGQASDYAQEVFHQCSQLSKEELSGGNVWKTVADACLIFSYLHQHVDDFPAETVHRLLSSNEDEIDYQLLSRVDGVQQQPADSNSVDGDDGASSSLKKCLHAALLASKRSLQSSANEVHARAVAWYNLGWAEYRAHICLPSGVPNSAANQVSGYLRASMYCFRRAIESEARNADFWDALGVAASTARPEVAQHAFVRSLYLNDKNARVWTNYGALCLLNEDHQLANMAFSRAQATDPEYPQAWLGQGLLALSLGERQEARQLFEHAFEIADGSVPLARRLYAVSTFDQLESGRVSTDMATLIQPLFALEQFRSQSTPDPPVDHLSALFQERAGHYELACKLLTTVCSSAEQDYEESESVLALTRFAQGKADLSRVLLALGDYEGAIENAETALQLSAVDDDEDETNQASIIEPATHRKCRLSAHLTAGLASYSKGDMDEALSRFRSALEESSEESVDIICLLAQILWAKGGSDERIIATEQLFDCVNRAPDHLQSILLLGVIATLNDDQETLDAVLSDLQGFRADNKFSPEQRQRIQEFIVTASSLSASSSSTSNETEGVNPALAEAKISIMLSPYASYGWAQLASLCEGEDHFGCPAQMALKTAQRTVPPRGSLSPTMLAEVYASTGTAKDAQSAIILAPWSTAGWNSLAEVLAN